MNISDISQLWRARIYLLIGIKTSQAKQRETSLPKENNDLAELEIRLDSFHFNLIVELGLVLSMLS